MTKGERVKYTRKELNHMTLEAFGERLGVTKSVLSTIENEKSNLTEQMAKSICREFHVSYQWLVNGIGEPEEKVDSEIVEKIEELMSGENETAKAIFKAFAALDDSHWQVIDDIIKKILEESK